MSLTTALNIAQSSLLATSRQTSVVSRNIADAEDPDYAHRTAMLVSTAHGVRTVVIQRAVNDQLFRQNLSALSAWSGQRTLADGLDRLELAVNGPDNTSSASTTIAALQNALQTYATSPSNRSLGDSVVEAARQVVASLNGGTQALQDFRTQADGEIAGAVTDLNTLLARFEDVNRAVVSGTRAGTDVSDALDQRDALLKKIAEYVPVSTFTRGDNDMVVTTADGTMLFETIPRSVSFSPSSGYMAGATGNTVYIDNVPLSAGPADSAEATGKLAGMLQLRDGVAVGMQAQLDEIARGLVTAFAEGDPPSAAGLFTWPGAPAVPAAGTLVNGLAGRISVNQAVANDPTLLRDGGINGAAYVVNTAGASYSGLLIAYGDRLNQPMAFAPSAGIAVNSSVTSYSANAIGWLEAVRQRASTAADNKEALATRTAEALSNATGVNVDAELSLLLDLEHTYQASARILNSVGKMLDTLLEAVN